MGQTAAANLSPEDVAAIRKVNEEWLRCMLAQDFEGLARLYLEDATLMPPHQPALQGRDAIRKWHAGFPRIAQLKFDHHEIDGRDDLAYVRGAYALTFESQGGAPAVDDVGKLVEIRRKQPDGSWLVAVDIFNSDR